MTTWQPPVAPERRYVGPGDVVELVREALGVELIRMGILPEDWLGGPREGVKVTPAALGAIAVVLEHVTALNSPAETRELLVALRQMAESGRPR